HIAAATAQGMPGADVETPAYPQLHWSRQSKLQPARQFGMIMAVTRKHPAHLGNQRQREQGGNDELTAVSGVLGALLRLFLRARLARRHTGLVAYLLDTGHQLLNGHPAEMYLRLLAGEIHRCCDARQLVQAFLDTRRAG